MQSCNCNTTALSWHEVQKKERQQSSTSKWEHDAYKAKPEDKSLEMEYLKAKNHLQVLEEANADRMDIMRALKQLYVRLNLTEKFEAIKKEMQQ